MNAIITKDNDKGVLQYKGSTLAPLSNIIAENDATLVYYTESRSIRILYEDVFNKEGTSNANELAKFYADNNFFNSGNSGSGVSLPIAQSDVTDLVSDLSTIDNRLDGIEQKEYKVLWWEQVVFNPTTDGQTFTVTVPTGGTIIENGFGSGVTAIIKQIADGYPSDLDIPDTDISTSEDVLAVTLDSLGNGVINGNTDISVYIDGAVIYYYSVNQLNFNKDFAITAIRPIYELELPNDSGAYILSKTSNISHEWKKVRLKSLINTFSLDPVSTTTSETFTPLINSNTSNLDVGDYVLEIVYSWAGSVTNQDFISQLLFDGVSVTSTVFSELHRQEPKDSGGSDPPMATNQKHSFYQEFDLSVTTSGVKPIVFQFATSASGDAMYCWFVKAKLYKIEE